MSDPQGSPGDASDMRVGALRRVVPIARTEIRGGLALTLFDLDEFETKFAFRCRLVARGDHPIRAHSLERRREEHAYAEALMAKRRQDGAFRGIAAHGLAPRAAPEDSGRPLAGIRLDRRRRSRQSVSSTWLRRRRTGPWRIPARVRVRADHRSGRKHPRHRGQPHRLDLNPSAREASRARPE